MTGGLHVEIRDPFGKVRQLSFDPPELLWIGREATCQLAIFAPNVSRWHASIEPVPEGLKITDASLNGTFVNGVALHRSSKVVPAHGCVLTIGAHSITISREGSSERRPTTPPLRALPGGASERKHLTPVPFRAAAETDPAMPQGDRLPRLVSGSDEVFGLGPLEGLLEDPEVSEIMVVNSQTVFAERRGRIELTGLRFADDRAVQVTIERLVAAQGIHLSESAPLVDARLPDGSRLEAIIPPVAAKGPCFFIRKCPRDSPSLADLAVTGSMSVQMATFLERVVRARKNVLIAGGGRSGKTTLLNALTAFVPSHDRVVTVEEVAELQLRQPHVVSLQAYPTNFRLRDDCSVCELVKRALRMRPDRIVIGDCRGGEAMDVLQAMSTGSGGSMTTIHANSPREAIARMEALCVAVLNLPVRAIRQQIASSVHVVLQLNRFSDGSRRVTNIAEVTGLDDDGEVGLREIFLFKVVVPLQPGGEIKGEFCATGDRPSFLDQLVVQELGAGGAPL